MTYIAKVLFTDAQDNEYPYEAGDAYPRAGLSPSPERIAELSGADNMRGIPVIVKAESRKGKKK